MPILTIILVLVLIGFLVWLAETYVPMDPTIRRILIAVVVILVVLWLLQVTGLWASLAGARV